ncbi:phage portal protein [Mycolicibacterium sp.]|uniref:phage portal protein n=1 Tax=Mycolicibacterium sp. TaxID=2320850 RepID=UPI00355FE54C
MSVFFRDRPRGVEARQWVPRPLSELVGLFRQSYDNVDLSTAENSLQSVAVRSAVDLLASMASELPVDVFSGTGSARRERLMPGYLEDPDGSGQGLPDWCYRVMVSWLLRGNLYGNVLDASGSGMLRQVDIFHPDRVHPQIENGAVTWLHDGREVPRMLHRRVNPVPGWLLGLSPVAYHMWTIGLSLTATRFGMQWFQDGAHPGGILRQTEKSIGEDQAKSAKDRFMAALRGTREPVVLGKGWEWKQLQVNPEESQFLQTQGFSAAECARIFGPGIAEILGYGGEGSSLTYANVVDRDLHVLKYALNRWLRRLERLLSEFLPRPQYVRFNRDALLQTNTTQRFAAYATALDKRFLTVNEVRDLEDMPRVEWGDEPNPVPGAASYGGDAGGDEPENEGDQR